MLSAKAELVRTAGLLFSQKGFHGTSVREIAEARGIRSGSLYTHIETKEDLLFEVVVAGAQAFLDAVEPVAGSELPTRDKLVRALSAHLGVVVQHREASRVFLHEWLLLTSPRRETVQALRDRYDRLWDGILRAGIAEGVIPAGVPLRYARIVCLSVANWAYLWYDPRGALDPSAMAEVLGSLLWGGVVGYAGGDPLGSGAERSSEGGK